MIEVISNVKKCEVRQKKGDIYELVVKSGGVLGISRRKMDIQFVSNQDKQRFEDYIELLS